MAISLMLRFACLKGFNVATKKHRREYSRPVGQVRSETLQSEFWNFGSPTWIRTRNLPVNSRALYR
jgi:hypothetical protein